jgi:hypothetical protein
VVELTIAIAVIVGAVLGGTVGLLISWAAGMYGGPRRRTRSTQLSFNEGPIQRGNGSGGPTTPKPPIKPQFPPPRIIPGDFP